uniref:Uncharacterized protein n=1 Tax=Nelumbo nucifera TaxID=4432 RepID=A0A822ZA76_NELNU|nr:TPA_asm: hypothetical protein HUJ06_000232 [Nelumbo nucifera]
MCSYAKRLNLMQEIVLCVSFHIHSSIFIEGDKSSWKLEVPSYFDSTLCPLLALFKLLKIKPYQKKVEVIPKDLDKRKRSLSLEGDSDETATLLPLLKRRKGGQHPEQSNDKQVISESALNKLVGTADTYNLEEMDPPKTLMCGLKPYQNQALYWMTELGKGIDVEQAAKTLHPCWFADRICDKRTSAIYVNNFLGEATTQFPSALILADCHHYLPEMTLAYPSHDSGSSLFQVGENDGGPSHHMGDSSWEEFKISQRTQRIQDNSGIQDTSRI